MTLVNMAVLFTKSLTKATKHVYYSNDITILKCTTCQCLLTNYGRLFCNCLIQP